MSQNKFFNAFLKKKQYHVSMYKNYKFKLYLNKSQLNSLKSFESFSKQIWNAGVWQYTTHSDNYYFCSTKEKLEKNLTSLESLKNYEISKFINLIYKYNVDLKNNLLNVLKKTIKERLELSDETHRLKLNPYLVAVCLEKNILTQNEVLELKLESKNLIQKSNIDYPIKLKSFFTQTKTDPPTAIGQAKEIVALKKTNKELSKFPSIFTENTLQLLELSQKSFFRNLKTNPKLAGRPLFKNENDNSIIGFKSKFSILETPYKSNYGYCTVATARNSPLTLGILKYRQYKPFKGAVKTVSLKKEVDGWYIVFSVQENDYKLPKTGNVTAFDLGVVVPVMQVQIKDNEKKPNFIQYQYPEEITKMEQRIKVLQKRMKNKKTGNRSEGVVQSNNSKKAYKKIAKIQAKIKKAKDYQIKLLTHKIVKENDIICIDNLKVRNMTQSAKGTIENPGKNVKQKSGLNRSILSNNWGEIKEKVLAKANEFGRKTYLVEPKNTSITCSCCGNVDQENRKTQEKFKCSSCDFETNADENAALNILFKGLKIKTIKELKKIDIKK